MSTVDELVTTMFRRAHDGTAFVRGNRRISFAEVEQCVVRLAGWLRASGIAPGDWVGITVADEFRNVVTALALLTIGAPQIILASHEPMALRAELARRCGVVALVAEAPHGAPDGISVVTPDFEAIFAGASRAQSPGRAIDLDALAFMACSSGSTGRPRLVPLTGWQYFTQLQLAKLWPGHEVCLIDAQIEFYNAQRNLLGGLLLGDTSILAGDQRESVVELCQRHRVQILRMVTPKAHALVDSVGEREHPIFPEGLTLRVYGAPVTPALRAAVIRSITPNLIVVYASTETGIITATDRHGHAANPDSVGRPGAGVTLDILDEDELPLGPDAIGRVRVRTPGMVHRYHDDEALSAAAFRDGWFYSGDLARRTRDGLVVLAGRVDDMMNLSGIKVFAAEIENVAATFPSVVECAAFPIKSPVFGDIPVLAVAAAASLDEQALLRFCRERLGHKAPRKVLRLERLPRNMGGKVSKIELIAMMGEARRPA